MKIIENFRHHEHERGKKTYYNLEHINQKTYCEILSILCLALIASICVAHGQLGSSYNSSSAVGISLNSTNVSFSDLGYISTVPEEIILLPEQLSDSVLICVGAIFNNSDPIFIVNNTTMSGNKITIELYSMISKDSKKNLTTEYVWDQIDRLQTGNYTVEVIDATSKKLIANQSFKVLPVGRLIDLPELNGILETFKGNLSDNSTLIPFTSALSPPGISKYTKFWINSTDDLILGINLTSKLADINNINLSIGLSDNLTEDMVHIDPTYCKKDNFSANVSQVFHFQLKTENIKYGAYNLTYVLNYSVNGENKTAFGSIPIGIYETQIKWSGNSTIMSLTSPFNDTFTEECRNWTNYSSIGEGWLPMDTTYTMNFSEFSLTEHSPMPHILAAALGGAALDAGLDLAGQVFLENKKIDFRNNADNAVDWSSVGKEAVISGVISGAIAAVPVVAAYGKLTAESLKNGGKLSNTYKYKSIGNLWDSGKKMEAVKRYIPWAHKQLRAAIKWSSHLDKYDRYLTVVNNRPMRVIASNLFGDDTGTAIITTVSFPIYAFMDSDKDGVSNIEELISNSNPFDTYSAPSGKIDTSIILLFDASGSMGENNKIDNAKTAAKNALYTLSAGDEAALIVFYDCNTIVVEQPFTTDWSSFASKIDSIEPNDKTPLYVSIEFANEYMKQNARGSDQRIVVLTDGLETCGGSA